MPTVTDDFPLAHHRPLFFHHFKVPPACLRSAPVSCRFSDAPDVLHVVCHPLWWSRRHRASRLSKLETRPDADTPRSIFFRENLTKRKCTRATCFVFFTPHCHRFPPICFLRRPTPRSKKRNLEKAFVYGHESVCDKGDRQ